MQTVSDAARLRAVLRSRRDRGRTVALIPTMGNLHAGHLALVDQARTQADCVVASIFVNPTQFGPDEDFQRYPRTPEQDQGELAAHACDLLFTPDVQTMYPSGIGHATRVLPGQFAAILEGAHRPGHFAGVAGIVLRLLNLVQPDVAIFGRKDYQQLKVIEHLVRDLGLSVDICAGAIVRDADGLALSSRNQFLDADQRRCAPLLYATLKWMCEQALHGHPPEVIENAAIARLDRAGFDPDYAVIRRADNLAEPGAADSPADWIALVAARLGRTRLIDNMMVRRET